MSSSKKSAPDGSRSVHLGQQRKRAKELLKGQRAGEKEALRRFAEGLPRLRGRSPASVAEQRLHLAEAQFVVAREAGFPSWPRMVHATETETLRPEERWSQALDAARRGDRTRWAERGPTPPTEWEGALHWACAVADPEFAERCLVADPGSVHRRVGDPGWTPLLFLTCAKVAMGEADPAGRRAAIAKSLFDAGARPVEETYADPELVQGTRSALSGAVARLGDARVVESILGAMGPEVPHLWQMGVVADAARLRDPACLELLLGWKPPSWELNGALSDVLASSDVARVARLIDAGADPNASGVWGRVGTALHQGVLQGAGLDVLEALIEGGVDMGARDRDGRTAFQVAVRCGRTEVAELLAARSAGASESGAAGRGKAHPGDSPSRATVRDRALSAAMLGDAEALEAALGDPGFDRRDWTRADHQTLGWAIRHGRGDAVPALLRAGLDPRVPEDDGEPILVLAMEADRMDLGEVLIGAGADPSARDFRGRGLLDRALGTPESRLRGRRVEWALGLGCEARDLVDFPSGDADLDRKLRALGAVERTELAVQFEEAVDAVVEGEIGKLRELLEAEPSLIRQRSGRPHRATLLHYVGANGFEGERQKTPPNGVEVLELLLEAGAEPDALCATYGGGPAQTTMALLVSSSWPADAGIQAELVRCLVRGGANPDGLDRDGVPMATAIAFRCAQAVDGLAESAELSNAVFAAAAGRVDLLREQVGEDGRLREGAGHCRVPWLHMPRDPVGGAERALMAAAQLGRTEALALLLERGVDPKAEGHAGITALHEAAFAGHLDAVELLLAHGADPGVRERQFKSTCLGWAAEGKRDAVFERLLRDHRPDLFDAVDFDLVEVAREHLVEDSSRVDDPDGRGGLLRYSCEKGREGMVRMLLEFGARTDIPDERGRTPLDHARAGGHGGVVALLEGHGAPPSPDKVEGRDPAD